MGQGSSTETPSLQTRVENPASTPQGLALICHGRLGGDYDGIVVRALAECLRDNHHMRVVTWNARGIGESEGGDEWSDLGIWMGDAGVNDYKRLLHSSMRDLGQDYPGKNDFQLFLCGYSVGAAITGKIRPLPEFSQFKPARYILVSYPASYLFIITLWKSGTTFRALEGIVQGFGWEGCENEPPAAGVLTLNGDDWNESGLGFGFNIWKDILGSKNKRGILKQVVVTGTNHVWEGSIHRIKEEVNNWLSDTAT